MHNIDRTNLESTYGEYEGEYSGEYGAGEFGQEFEGLQEFEGNTEFETYGEYEGTISEAEEMELAAELLSVSNEAELEQFLGKLFKKAGTFIRSPVGQKLMGTMKGLAKKALPMLGSAVGNMIVPGLGGVIGGKLASAAGGMFGLELEGLSYEDQEFEVAKQIVRFGSAAAANAAKAPPTAPPHEVHQSAVTAAAQQFVPGLLRRNGPAPSTPSPRYRDHRCAHNATGRWVRRGNAILLLKA